MKQSLLDKLKGRRVFEARDRVREAGYQTYIVPTSSPITGDAKRGVVVLWTTNGVVTDATAGDPTEVEFDQPDCGGSQSSDS